MTEIHSYYFQIVLETESLRGMDKFTTLYFSHVSPVHFSIYDILPMIYARIPLQFRYSLLNLTKRAKFTELLKGRRLFSQR